MKQGNPSKAIGALAMGFIPVAAVILLVANTQSDFMQMFIGIMASAYKLMGWAQLLILMYWVILEFGLARRFDDERNYVLGMLGGVAAIMFSFVLLKIA